MFVHNREDRDKEPKNLLDTRERNTITLDFWGRVKSRVLEVWTYNLKTQTPSRKVTVFYKMDRKGFFKTILDHPMLKTTARPMVIDEGDRIIIEPSVGEDLKNEEITG